METFSCPNCGASLEVEPYRSATVKCAHCSSTVIVPEALRPPQPVWNTTNTTGYGAGATPAKSFPYHVVAIALMAALGIIWLVAAKNKPDEPARPDPRNFQINFPTPDPTATPTPTPDDSVAMTFGGEGTGAGLFKDASEVSVGGDGSIYVADDTTRIQRFDASGKFLNMWMIPAETKWYKKLRGNVQKLLADSQGNVYVVVTGVILKFQGNTGELLGAAHGTDYIHDACLLREGGLAIVSEKGGRDDELVRMDGTGKAVKRVHRFVSSQLDKRLDVSALRVATDGVGNTYAIYALGDVYGEHWYDSEDLAIFKFAPDGKYVMRFGAQGREAGQYRMPNAIAVDKQNRVLIGDSSNGVHLYADDGRYLETIKTPVWVRGMCLDDKDNLYVVGSNTVSRIVLNK